MDVNIPSPQDSAIELHTPRGSRAQSVDGGKRADGPTIYIRNDDHDQILTGAPPALRFLDSYTRLAEGPNTPFRAKHFSPRATVMINGDLPAPIHHPVKTIDERSELMPAMHSEHILPCVWASTEIDPNRLGETLLVDCKASVMYLKDDSASDIDLPGKAERTQFTILELEQAPPSEGIHGLWIVESNDWMDDSLEEEWQEKLLLAVVKESDPDLALTTLLHEVKSNPAARAELYTFISDKLSGREEAMEEDDDDESVWYSDEEGEVKSEA